VKASSNSNLRMTEAQHWVTRRIRKQARSFARIDDPNEVVACTGWLRSRRWSIANGSGAAIQLSARTPPIAALRSELGDKRWRVSSGKLAEIAGKLRVNALIETSGTRDIEKTKMESYVRKNTFAVSRRKPQTPRTPRPASSPPRKTIPVYAVRRSK